MTSVLQGGTGDHSGQSPPSRGAGGRGGYTSLFLINVLT